MKDVIVDRSKYVKYYAYGFLGLSLGSAFAGYSYDGILSLICWLLVPVCGYLSAIIFSNISDHPFALKVDGEGITDYTPGLGVGMIRWDEIRDMDVNVIEGNRYMLIRVENTKKFTSLLPLPKQWLLSIQELSTKWSKNGFLPIHLGSLNIEDKTLFETIAKEWEDRNNTPSQEKRTMTPDEYDASDEPDSSPDSKTIEQPDIDSNTGVHDSGKKNDSAGVYLSDLDALEKLAELRDKNIITEEEFIAKKNQIMGF